jgi:hypothetical protein
MAEPTGFCREVEGHPLRLLEDPDRITEAVARGQELDGSAFDQARPRVTIDAAESRVLPVLHPAAAVHPCQIQRDDAIEALADLEMQRGSVGQMTCVAEVVAPFETIAQLPTDSRQQ